MTVPSFIDPSESNLSGFESLYAVVCVIVNGWVPENDFLAMDVCAYYDNPAK
jgi:hypothetical protein